MAKPQIEDGHVKIANEIVDQLSKINLSPYESRVLWAIWRKTYGWHKKSDRINYTQFQQITGLDRWHIARAIKRLKARNIIAVSGNKHKLIYSFQKDYDKWQPLPVEATKQTSPLQATKTPKALPVEATNLLPVEAIEIEKSSKSNVACRGNTPLPVEATNLLPVEANTKAKSIYTKAKGILSEKEKYLFQILKRCPAIKGRDAYKLPELLNDYPGINYELEFKKFIEWWPGPKKRKKPWAVLRNWLEKIPIEEKPLKDSGFYKELDNNE